MTCIECRDQLSAYVEGEKTGEARARLDAHLDSCPECAERLEGMKKVMGALGTMRRERVSDSFTFEMRRRLAREFDREQSWVGRLAESIKPTSQTAVAAAVGTLTTVALLFMFGTGGFNGDSTAPVAPTADAGEVSSEAGTRDVRYVLEQVPLDGELIEVSATVDSAAAAAANDSAAGSDMTPVRADF